MYVYINGKLGERLYTFLPFMEYFVEKDFQTHISCSYLLRMVY